MIWVGRNSARNSVVPDQCTFASDKYNIPYVCTYLKNTRDKKQLFGIKILSGT